MWFSALSLALLVAADPAARQAPDAGPRSERVEHFLLLATPDLEALPVGLGEPRGRAAHAPLVVGAARWTSAPIRRGGRYLELELSLAEEQVRVIHSEERFAAEASAPAAGSAADRLPARSRGGGLSGKLVWRELGPGVRRMLVLERVAGPGGEVRRTDASGGDRVRHDAEAPRGAWPLQWLEGLRYGHGAVATAVVSPLSVRTETLTPTVVETPTFGALRIVNVHRTDGSLYRRLWLVGSALVAMRLGDDGPVAVRTTPERFRSVASATTGDARGRAVPASAAPESSGRARD